MKSPGGEGGIRTHGTVSGTPHFECGAFDHSATSPRDETAPAQGRSVAGSARPLAAVGKVAKPDVQTRRDALPSAMTKAIVIGAQGGIGSALAAAIEARGGEVIRLSRHSDPPLDLDDDGSIAAAAAALAERAPFDLILIATGLLHGTGVSPEKSVSRIDGAALDRLFRINATGPALVMRHFLPLLARDRRSVMAALSARVGSIGDNRLGGWVGYRSAKAALNQIITTVAIELARTHPNIILAGLHPGTVATDLSAPFQRNVAPDRLFTPAQSAAHLLDVIDGLMPTDSGGCLDFAGKRIAP